MRRFLILICMLFFIVGCGNQYPAEKLYWKANKFSEQIFRNPKGTPLSQYEKAISRFEKIIRKYPDLTQAKEAQFKIAQLYVAREDFPGAIKEFEKTIRNYPDDIMLCAKAQFAIGNCYQQQGDWDKALIAYRKVFSDYKDTPFGLEVPLYIARYYERNEQNVNARKAFREAIKEYKKIIKEHPKSQGAYIVQDYIAFCYLSLQDWPNAIKSLNKLINDFPKTPKTAQALITMGALYQNQLKQPKRAISVYQKFLKDYPKHKLVYAIQKRLDELKSK